MSLAAIYRRLQAEPWRFGFDAAVRLLMRLRRRADPAEAARFRTVSGLAYPAADIVRVAEDKPGQPPALTVTLSGLSGPSGVLPRHYSETVVQQDRLRAEGLHSFLDLLGNRMVAAFAEAAIKYRPARTAEQAHLGDARDAHREVLLALIGEAEPALARAEHERQVMLFHAGYFAAWPRSAERLEAMLSAWMEHPVQVLQFQGGWLRLPRDQQTRLPKGRDRGAFRRLGVDAAIGARSWDPHGRVVIRIAGLGVDRFRRLLPDQEDAGRLAGLVRAYLGPAVDFAINPVLRAEAVPGTRLGAGHRLGWDSWLAMTPRSRGGDEARFPAAQIEGRSVT